MSEPNSPGPSNENESSICIDEDQVIVEPAVPVKSDKPSTVPPVPIAPGTNKKAPYIGDPMLLPRVVEYINSLQDKNNPGERYVDVEEIVEELQRRYREYRKKKRAPFKASVQKALTIIMQETCSDEEDDSEEDSDMMEMSAEESGGPDSNNQVVNMYLQSKARQGKVTMDGDKELIDIGSSDEEDDDDDEETLRQISATQAILRQEEVARAYANGAHGAVASSKSNAAAKEAPRSVPNILRKRKSPPEADSSYLRQQLSQQQGGNQNKKRKMDTKPPSTSFSDIGGNENCLKEVCQLLVHMKHPEVYTQLGVSPPRGFLLHGPPGCGKTLLANAIAGELQLPLLKVAATELVAGVSGESEERIRDLFEQATSSAPCVLFIDEIDAIAPHRATAQREMERRIVAQLLASMDELAKSTSQVLVVGATNRPDSLDPALRRAGRFDREVSLGIPDENARTSILGVICTKLRLAPGIDLAQLGRLTPGFVGADLAALAREAAMAAVNRVLSTLKSTQVAEKKPDEAEKPEEKIVNGEMAKSPEPKAATSQPLAQLSLPELTDWLKDKPPLSPEQLQSMSIEQQDFDKAIKSVQPSAKREGFATVPGVTWDDVGSLQDVREDLKIAILAPVKFAEQFASLGLSSAAGVLLCGPPGCGKTLLAKAVANEAGINFISVKGPELLNMYVGESERAVRQCFQRAKNSAPCVIFFDELDSLCPKRSEHGEGGASARVVNQMLTEMDGVEGRQGVFLMAATNRPDMVDPAVLRPGRLDKTIYIGLPGPEDRADILRALTKNGTSPQLDTDVDLNQLGLDISTDGYTGADLAALVREASLSALRGIMAGEPDASLVVKKSHFAQALERVRPSVSDMDKKRYESLRQLYGPKPKSFA